MKISNKKKFIRSIMLILLIIVGLSLIISKATYSHGEKQYKTIYVSNGDTLWGIANIEIKSNIYYKDKDIRHVINSIYDENNLNSSDLQINQELRIPII